MQAKGAHDNLDEAKRLLEMELAEAEARQDDKRVEQLRTLANALETGRMLIMQEAQDYLSLFGYPVKTRLSFYKFSEITHSIPYEDLNPAGKNRARLYSKEVLDLFIKHRKEFENTSEEINRLLKLKDQDRALQQKESQRLGFEKLDRLKKKLAMEENKS
jgi:hypothetical protein